MAETVSPQADYEAWARVMDYSFMKSPVVQVADWIGLVVLFGTSALIFSKLYTFKPEGSRSLYFFGYEREAVMIPVYINWFAFTSYFAKCCKHVSGVDGSELYTYRYLDYMTTCPLLTLCLMVTLNLPYKLTCSIIMAIVILCGFMTMWIPSPGRYLWFVLGCTLFAIIWYTIIVLSQVRFMQYFGKKHRITSKKGEGEERKKKRESFATKKGLRDKKLRQPIQYFLATYFLVWIGYPILWLLEEFKVIPNEAIYVCHVVLDLLAKVIFGFCVIRFQFLLDKIGLNLENLTVTLSDMLDDYHMAMKKDKAAKRARNKHEEKYGIESANEVFDPQEQQDANYLYGSQDFPAERYGNDDPLVSPQLGPRGGAQATSMYSSVDSGAGSNNGLSNLDSDGRGRMMRSVPAGL